MYTSMNIYKFKSETSLNLNFVLKRSQITYILRLLPFWWPNRMVPGGKKKIKEREREREVKKH